MADKETPTEKKIEKLPQLSQYAYQLRDRLLASVDGEMRNGCTLVVTSCHRREGVTSVATSLALGLSESSRGSLLLCDTNLTAPAVHKILRIAPAPGLVDVLDGRCPVEEAVRSTPLPSLYVLPCGSRRMNPSALVESPAFESLFSDLRKRYSFVVLDAPPVVDCHAAARLAGHVDGTILVIEAERGRWEVAQKVTGLLEAAGARILGVVFNKRRFHIPNFLYRRL